MNSSSFAGLSARELGQMMHDKKISPVEVTRAVLNRIQKLDDKVNAFIRVDKESAIAQAEKAQQEIIQGRWRGLLHGVPFALKDIFDVAGIPSTAGSKVWKDFVPKRDAVVVKKLKQAGAVLIGKLNMHELAFGITSRNPHFGATLNPWDLSCSCGGSSSGSAAALAAGFVPLTLGTDTGGSIRIPSSLTGVVGFKPTYGLVSRTGILPLAWSMDHIGPMAIHVEDIALALDFTIDRDAADQMGDSNRDYTPCLRDDLKGIVIGIPTEFFYDQLREDIKDAVLGAVESMKSLGAQVREITIPGIVEADRAAFTVLFSEAACNLEIHARNRPQEVGEEVMRNVRLGMTIPATRYIQALRVRTKLYQELQELFSKIDLLAVPATMVDAHPIDDNHVDLGPGRKTDVRTAMTRYTRYFNLAGNPVLSMPCGFSKKGLPVGMQLAGPHHAEAKVLRVGYAYQKAFPLNPLLPNLE